MRKSVLIVAALVALACASTALAGGWATVKLNSTPKGVTADEPWVVDGDLDNGFLAKCKTFDGDAVSSFFSSLQFRGPERFDPSQLQPGH